ncbi:MAG: NAD-dependent epimerase/dehydratase family protein [Bacteroidota bacterium]
MVFVTGGTGFVGSHLLFNLVSQGRAVRALKRSQSDTSRTKRIFSYYSDDYETLFSKIEWVEGDLLDIYSLDEAMKGISRVFHCAGVVSFSKTDNALMSKTNADGTANLVNAALENNIEKLCHVSSIAAIGSGEPGETIDEDTLWRTSRKNSGYAKSKYYSEQEIWRGAAEGLNTVVVNPSVIIGPGSSESLIEGLLDRMPNGFNFYTLGVNGFVDVRDVVTTMITLMDGDFHDERYIVSSENVSYRDILNYITDTLGMKRPRARAGRFLTELAWTTEKLRTMITGRKPGFTKETARISQNLVTFSNKKITNATGIQFIPVSESVKFVCDTIRGTK